MSMTLDENPEPFIVLDNFAVGSRLIILASQTCLGHLARSQTWYVDGNFGMSPCNLNFQQLYIIRCDIGRSAVSTVYALMERKNADSYRELFTAIIGACPQRPNPLTIHMDFEAAVINTVRELFPHTNIAGCFYHLCQVGAVLIFS